MSTHETFSSAGEKEKTQANGQDAGEGTTESIGQSNPANPAEMPFLSHLIELRDRLLRSVLAILIIFLGLFPFSEELYTFLASPLMAYLPEGSSMVAIEVATPFLTPLKLSLIAAIFLAIPWLLYQLWSFVAPGLYKHEKQLAVPLMVSSSILFYAGMLFAYYVVFPLVFGFFVSVLPEGVQMATDISRYLDFVLKMFFAFGVAFEVPVFTVLLVWTGMVTPDQLVAKRPYIIVSTFIVGMVLTPPDVFSQTLLAVPMWMLFELGVVASRVVLKHKEAREKARADEEGSQADGDEYQPMSDEEMDAEMARMDEWEKEDEKNPDTTTPPEKN